MTDSWKVEYNGKFKACINCKHSTEERLKSPHAICLRAHKICKEKGHACVRDMGIGNCWEPYIIHKHTIPKLCKYKIPIRM